MTLLQKNRRIPSRIEVDAADVIVATGGDHAASRLPDAILSASRPRPGTTGRNAGPFNRLVEMGRYYAAGLLLHLLLTAPLQAVTLKELTADPKLTPKRFAKYFSGFAYCYHEEVQPPEVFLATESGDCDDYATLADTVLHPKGYGTRLICVRMPGLAHVVCYVVEERGYLDYNKRSDFNKIESAGAGLREIANKVAKSFDANWTSAGEFIYLGDNMKRLVEMVAKTDDPGKPRPALDPKLRIKIDF